MMQAGEREHRAGNIDFSMEHIRTRMEGRLYITGDSRLDSDDLNHWNQCQGGEQSFQCTSQS